MIRHFTMILSAGMLLLMFILPACSAAPTAMPAPTATSAPEPTAMPAPTATSAPTSIAVTGNEPSGDEAAVKEYEEIDPTQFSDPTTIDNEWMPLKPGTRFVYEGVAIEEGESVDHRIEFTVTDLTKEIGGINTVVVWILDYSNGELIEKEIAFYAQDDSGNVWYLGEHPEEYEDGQFVDAPTWIHGYQDARAGIKMPASPSLDLPSYSQGWGPEVDFRDRGKVAQMGLEDCVPVSCYEDVIVIDEFTTVEPNAFQTKFYTRGVGNTRVGWRGEDANQEDLELVEFTQASAEMMAQIRADALDLEKHVYEISEEVYALTTPAK